MLEQRLSAVDGEDRPRDGPGRGEKHDGPGDVAGIDGAFERERGGDALHAGGAEFAGREDGAGGDGVNAYMRGKLKRERQRVT